jgi:hypothetical protein
LTYGLPSIISAVSNNALRQKLSEVEVELVRVEGVLIEVERSRKSLKKELKIARQDRPFRHRFLIFLHPDHADFDHLVPQFL